MKYLVLFVYSVVIIIITYYFMNKRIKGNEKVIIKEVENVKLHDKPYATYTSTTGRLILSNESQKLFGISKGNVLIDEVINRLELSFIKNIRDQISKISSGENFSIRFRFKKEVNDYIWIETTAKVSKSEKITNVYFEFVDISQIMKLENKNTLIEATLKSVIENTKLVSFFSFDNNEKIRIFNKRFYYKVERILGWKIKKNDGIFDFLIGSGVDKKETSKLYTQIERYVKCALSGEKGQSLVKLNISDISTLILECEYSPIITLGNNRIGGIIFLRDVTKEFQDKEELIKEKQIARSANKAKSKFLANMGHEIRTPLNGVLGMTELLLDTDLDAKQMYMLNIIKESGRSLLGVINDILDFSKIEAGEITLLVEAINIRESILIIEEMFKYKAIEKGIKFKMKINEDVPQYISIDLLRLKQILTNLIGNAFKFIEQGHIFLSIEVCDNDLRFLVEDTGIGIPEDKIEHIFMSFKQVSDDTTKKYGGTGLGLSITKELIEIMGGRVRVMSKVGLGSVFYFNIPLIIPNEEEVSLFNKSVNYEKRILTGMKVLVAEDNDVNKVLMKEILSMLHCDFKIVSNGKEVLKSIKESNYNCILMDISMPEMDGIQATKIIREIHDKKSLPIVALTAHASVEYKNMLFEIGINDYITKPVDTMLLAKALSKYFISEKDQKNKTIEMDNMAEGSKKNPIENSYTMVYKDNIEFEFIQNQVMGNKELVVELGFKVVEMLESEIIPGIEKFASEGNLEKISDLVHKAKGSVSNFGQINLLKHIKGIDKNILDKDMDMLKGNLDKIKSELKNFHDNIVEYESNLQNEKK